MKDSTRVIGGAEQGGLGLPDRDYYTKTDDKSKQVREQYRDHVIKMFALAGMTPRRLPQRQIPSWILKPS